MRTCSMAARSPAPAMPASKLALERLKICACCNRGHGSTNLSDVIPGLVPGIQDQQAPDVQLGCNVDRDRSRELDAGDEPRHDIIGDVGDAA